MNFRTNRFALAAVATILMLGMLSTNICHAAKSVKKSDPAEGSTALITDTYVGGLLGVASVDQERGSGVGYNLQGAHYFFGMFGAGLFIHGGSHTQGLSSFFYGAQALFRPLSILPRLQLGALLARGRFSAGGISGTLNPAYGAKAAYDVALSDHYPITAGLELSVLSTTPNDKTFLIFSPLASLKLWL